MAEPTWIRSMADGTADQWSILGRRQREVSTADRVLELLHLMAGHTDGFAITQLEHCLQVATRAERAGADPELVVAALCHDVAKVLPHCNHGSVAADLLRPHVRADVAEIVRTHSAFQRRYTHVYLGGDPEQRRRYRRKPWYSTAEQFCEWDQSSFDPDYDALPLEHFEQQLHGVFSHQNLPTPARRVRRVVRRTLAALVYRLGIA